MKIVAIILALFFSVGHISTGSANSDTLDNIKARGYLRCGVNIGLLGFSIKNRIGQWEGFDVEFCRALSVAIFNSADKIEYIPLSGKERFSALKYNKIDVLYRNSTMTALRDTSLGIVFPGINYYDGQGFLIHKDRNTNSAYKLQGSTFCMTDGTSSLRNLNDFLALNDLSDKVTVLKYRSAKEVLENINNGSCNASSSDQSQLYSQRISLNNPDDFLILPEIISKEPLGPAVKEGDHQWFSIVRWTLTAMIEAEFLNMNSNNISSLKESDNNSSSVARLLGLKGDIGKSLDLDNAWSYNIINKIGNYGEVFERTIGSQSKLGIARGLNAQWNEGGILYSSPF
ncbi:MAG: general L-amino acid transport system substrate-binding protein [Candidatus Endobugula sp.]|jgi:general L-amino acid transport system substrate-binding protein